LRAINEFGGFEATLFVDIMAVRVVEISNGGYKFRKVFAYESTYF
jgi:hypothetical protein